MEEVKRRIVTIEFTGGVMTMTAQYLDPMEVVAILAAAQNHAIEFWRINGNKPSEVK